MTATLQSPDTKVDLEFTVEGTSIEEAPELIARAAFDVEPKDYVRRFHDRLDGDRKTHRFIHRFGPVRVDITDLCNTSQRERRVAPTGGVFTLYDEFKRCHPLVVEVRFDRIDYLDSGQRIAFYEVISHGESH